MTENRKLKQEIRERMARTGENYTAARRHVLESRDEGTEPEADSEEESE